MELWTEYEGTTIDGAFPLTRLLQPEGRSALFSTSNGTGVPKVIRLIESHFDDDEILARWRGVAALNHPNLRKLEKYGQVMLDETSLVYAVMEPADANLGEVVASQRLTVPDARQLAVSLMAALDALHSHGFVHEHVEAANVLAVGEVVKLRSDCIREAPEGSEGQELKRRDVHNATVVLLQALTQQRTLEAAARDLPLPAPFDQIVPKGLSGEWGVAEISAALEATDPSRPAPEPVVTSASPAAGAPVNLSPNLSPNALPKAAIPPEPQLHPASPSAERTPPLVDDEDIASATPASGRTARFAVVILVALLCLWLAWHFLHIRPANQAPADQAQAPQQAATPPPVVDSSAAKPAAAIAPAPPAKAEPVPNNDGAGGGGQWRVIAYTYNRQDQAQHKSETVAQRHPELHPEVFTPTGHAPYLVTVGGAMSREEAFALVKKVRGEGLPGDTYAQNYTGRER